MADPEMQQIGLVLQFFAHPSAGVVALTAPLKIGEQIYVKGHTTDFQQVVESMQLDHQPVQEAAAGQEVAIKMTDKCRKHDVVYKLA